MDDDATRAFEAFVLAHGRGLGHVARLLTADRQDAADLTQATLERAFVRWGKVSAADDPAAYVRRMLVNASIDASRRRSRQPRTTSLIDGSATDGGFELLADRDALRSWLSALPARQRAVVLRYYVGLTEAETAGALGIGVGSVKTHASRGLARLRTVTEGRHV